VSSTHPGFFSSFRDSIQKQDHMLLSPVFSDMQPAKRASLHMVLSTVTSISLRCFPTGFLLLCPFCGAAKLYTRHGGGLQRADQCAVPFRCSSNVEVDVVANAGQLWMKPLIHSTQPSVKHPCGISWDARSGTDAPIRIDGCLPCELAWGPAP
jgi:hypothetical protein